MDIDDFDGEESYEDVARYENSKIAFQKEKYARVFLDHCSDMFWNKDGANVDDEWFPWANNPKGEYFKRTIQALKYIFNNGGSAYNENEVKIGFFANHYLVEHTLMLAIELKKAYPDWTFETHNLISQSHHDHFMIVETDTNYTDIINEYRSNIPEINPSLLLIEDESEY